MPVRVKTYPLAAAFTIAASTVMTTISTVRSVHAQSIRPLPSFDQLSGTHDIALSPWGPYSKRYAGISHIPDMRSGFRFDVSVAPGIVGSKPVVPNVLKPSGYIPWDIDSRMTHFTYRYELQWKDQVFVDVTYTIVDAKTVLMEMRCVNHTAQPQNLALNVFANMVYPTVYPRTQIQTSGNAFWVNAAQYTSLELSKRSPTYNLQTDGALRGEVRGKEFIDGRAVGRGFGANAGDTVTYDLPIRDRTPRQGVLRLRYRMKEGTQCTLHATGLVTADILLKGTGSFETVSVPYTRSDPKGSNRLNRLALTSGGGDAIDLNGLIVVPQGESEPQIRDAAPINNQPTTTTTENDATRTIRLKYDAVPNAVYGLAWDASVATVSNLQGKAGEDFDSTLTSLDKAQGAGTVGKYSGAGDANYTNLSIRSIALSANSEQTVRAVVVAAGSDDQAAARLAQIDVLQRRASALKSSAGDPFAGILPQGQKYTQSQRLMRSTVLSDIVYPVYTQGTNIRHFTPGKKWDSLYTWDAGFIALGLAEINRDLAIQCVNAYTTPVGSQSAFIHHGSPVPTQMFAFLELWQRTQSPELLQYFYPRLVQYYRFLSGSAPTSTTRNLKSSLVRTWDYFYNSGGWDDYPPQVAAHKQHLEQSIAPVVSTAHCIRVAKILRMAAKQLGRLEDIAGYDRDIAVFSDSLQKNSWDENAGYFSYVLHDRESNPTGHFQYTNAGTSAGTVTDPVNYNMGLDGVYPLFAGICTPHQQEVLLEKIFSSKHLWTPAGIGAVDQSAPYYRP
ncbi:MAG: glycoside hydrolase, partial [Armatimonadota bacterium]